MKHLLRRVGHATIGQVSSVRVQTPPARARMGSAPAPGAVVCRPDEDRRSRGPWSRGAWIRLIASLALVVVVVSMLVLRWLMLQPPAWWRSVDPTDRRIIELATRVQNALLTEAHRTDRPMDSGFVPMSAGQFRSQPWMISVSAELANAWLSVEMPKWLLSEADIRVPAEVREIQAEFRSGRVFMGVRHLGESGERYYWIELEPRLEGDGRLWLPAQTTVAGLLPVPKGMVLDTAIAAAEASRREVLAKASAAEVSTMALGPGHAMRGGSPAAFAARVLAGDVPALNRAEVRLDDGRRVRLLDIRARAGKLELTFVTERMEAPKRHEPAA